MAGPLRRSLFLALRGAPAHRTARDGTGAVIRLLSACRLHMEGPMCVEIFSVNLKDEKTARSTFEKHNAGPELIATQRLFVL